MGAAWLVAVADLRRNRLRLVALALLVALAGGVSVAAILGAERSRTSLDRFIEATNAADAIVSGDDPEQLSAVSEIPGVATASRISILGLSPRNEPEGLWFPMIASHDGRIPYELNGARVVAGELPSPDDDDRIALHEASADQLGVEVGDRLPMVGLTPADVRELDENQGELDAPSGPRFELEVAALIRDPLDVMNRPEDPVMTWLTEGVAERFGDEVGSLAQATFVVLEPGTDFESFASEVRDARLEVQLERWVGSGSVSDTGFGPALDLIGDGLSVFGLVVAIAGLLVIGQALMRGAMDHRADGAALDALGLDRRSRLLAACAPGIVVAVIGGALVVPVALVLSARFPIGLAGRAEPEPGMEAHAGILFGGGLTMVVLLALVAATTEIAERRATLAHLEPRSAGLLPTPGAVGRTMSSGQRSTVRSTRVAVLLGAAGVAAALVFANSLDGLLGTPEHYGWSFDTAFSGERYDTPDVEDGVDLAADPAVAEVARAIFQIELDVQGSPMSGYAVGDGSGEIGPVVADGSVPRAADEVAIGRESMRRLGVSIGDRVRISSGETSETFDIVGQAVVPVSSDGGRIGDGVSMTLLAAARLGLGGDDPCEDAECYQQTTVRWHDDADLAAARSRLLGEGSEFDQPTPPPEVERLDEVQSIPWVLAALLAVLAASAAGHAIAVTVNRRRRDLAVLRALGATPGDARRGVTSHAVSMVIAVAVLGAGAGVAIGRLLWGSVAGSVGVVSAPAVPIALVLSLPLGIVVLAAVASVLPARRAGQVRPSAILRAE
jgi:hypothetical protein